MGVDSEEDAMVVVSNEWKQEMGNIFRVSEENGSNDCKRLDDYCLGIYGKFAKVEIDERWTVEKKRGFFSVYLGRKECFVEEKKQYLL